MNDAPQPADQADKLNKQQRKQQRREERQRERDQETARAQRRSLIRWVGLAVVLLLVVVWVWRLAGRPADQDGSAGELRSAVAADDWQKGGPPSPEASARQAAVLVEYGDFQCPACAAFQPVVKDLGEELGEDLLVVYRHFPLRALHPQAQLAAQAAEAAGRQDRFWEMHDRLFERQADWAGKRNAEEIFNSYAAELGLNAEQFAADLQADEAEDAVDADYRSGTAAGVNSTPTFFLDGQQVQISSVDDFSEQVRRAARTP